MQRIASSPKITVHARTEIAALDGDRFLFVMIGAEPNTEWLNGCLELDGAGFIKTGRDNDGRALASPFATTRAGVFAVGDVRSGSVKRVASGVGEGSVVVQAIHQFLNPGVA